VSLAGLFLPGGLGLPLSLFGDFDASVETTLLAEPPRRTPLELPESSAGNIAFPDGVPLAEVRTVMIAVATTKKPNVLFKFVTSLDT
jgi:hypothetical protein